MWFEQKTLVKTQKSVPVIHRMPTKAAEHQAVPLGEGREDYYLYPTNESGRPT
ncbi:MAG: hypothetical protein HC780_28045 [Leptolyngbyaceae cyanobacterium CSU_1_3]|nr:hypothetical protein [Leptolyngbyaceae cyanobacterium CSU_1_3]